MRAAIHLHLYYPDVALDLIDRIARLGRADIDVLVTHIGALDPVVDRALDRIPARVVRVETPNRGWDIGPLFHLLPLIREEGYEAVCHLHTKKGDSGFASAWREMAYDGLIANSDLVTRILESFAARPDLKILGPAKLYISSAAHQFRNAEIVSALATEVLRPMYPLADWGFFAGTFFWARPDLLERVARVADFGGESGERDGTLAHAIERLFGLAPVADTGAIGLVGDDGRIEIALAPGYPSHQPIINTLATHRSGGAHAVPPDPEIAALVVAYNPLVHFIRHGRDEGALDPNPYFATRWYNRVQGDMYAAGMHPLHHYILHGAEEGRSTGPLFDADHYRRTHGVSGNPLRHFLETGIAQGLSAVPPQRDSARDPAEKPCRFYKRFDVAAEAAFLHTIAALPPKQAKRADATRVSVIMPAFNRDGVIETAIRSVLAQTHANFELIVVDDGSTDRTRDVVRAFHDPRIILVEGAHAGVSAARNLGLERATGEIVAYLDSDNRWNGWFLEVMVRYLISADLDAASCAISLRDDVGQLVGYIGDDFDWEACLQQNYIDLNAFCHRRALLDACGAFDTKLKRMVDWDLILRLTKGRKVGFAPFLGCDYSDAKLTAGRVTTSEPAAYQRLVWTKNRYGLAIGTPEYMAKLSLRFSIKIAAPEDEKDAWGDWHFADSLAASIRALGHEVQIDFRGTWHNRSLAQEDVVIVLRGLIPYEPRVGQLSFLWNISHPDQVGYEEYDRYSRVYVASESYADLLRHLISRPVTALLQATDPERFHPIDNPPNGPDLVFCGNSRGVERDIVRWAIEADRPPALYGAGWDGLVPPDLVKAANVDNRELGALYAGAGAVLNDHWPSMAAFGLLSNRLFDVVAAGGKAISDPVPSIARTFGPAVTEVSGPAALRLAADRLKDAKRLPGAAEAVIANHSFDARARRLVSDALAALGLDAPFEAPSVKIRPLPMAVRREKPLRIHLIAPFGPHGPQSSATIRLIAPLTDESIAGRCRVSLGRAEDPVPPCDVCIVQRAALSTIAAVDALVGTLGVMGAALVVDVDDAFCAMDDHAEAHVYRPLNAAIEHAIAASAETWFSTPELARLYGHVAHRHAVMSNMLDPRIWRDWRYQRPVPFRRSAVRMLYMGTNTHGADFALIRPALERLAEERPGAFELTLIGVAPDIENATWLYRQSPPAEHIPYARFVRWLRAQGPYDVGLAPLANTRFNSAKSDIKLLDYLALGLLPVVQDCPAYRLDPAMAEGAVHATDWFETLRNLIDDRDAARRRAARGAELVWEKRAVASIADGMIRRLEALL